MLSDRWTIMNNSSSELDCKQPRKHKKCCRYLLWSVITLLAVVAIVTVTGLILYLNEFQLPFINRAGASSDYPVISTNPTNTGALVTVSRFGGGEPISIFLDPNCPDHSQNFLRWEELHTSLLRALTNHNKDDWREKDLVKRMAEQMNTVSSNSHSLRLEADSLKRGQTYLQQQVDGIKSDSQVWSDTHAAVMKLAADFSDSLIHLQTETDSLRRLKSDLQRDNRGVRPTNCRDIIAAGVTKNGVYSIFPPHDEEGFRVYCDMKTDGGGWTVIQRREDGSVNFFRGWEAYRDGFGKTTGEHWLGLQRIYSLTRSGGFELRIDLADFDNATAFAHYADFSVGQDSVNPEEDGYPLIVDQYSGTAGDSLLKHSGMRFTTKDRDHDQSENNCASYYQGAWWYRNCHTSNLNGQYLAGGHASYADGVEWSSWTGWQYSLKFTEMKIRPRRNPDP
ncbi:fibrinogen C domain-containing protein 1-like [Synchiropus picturatus]